MKNEIKIRQKRMLGVILIAALLWNNASPLMTYAANYTNTVDDTAAISDGQIVVPGDTIKTDAASSLTIFYFDWGEDDGMSIEPREVTPGETYTVEDYMGSSLTTESFAGWRVKNIAASGDYIVSVSLYAVKQNGITYMLDGGSNAETNPTTYIEGIGVESFGDASKTGYTFEGWYADADFSQEVTCISETETENVTLYAKFTQNKIAIAESGTVSLKAGAAYELGNGTWKVAGDDTVYTGGITFYVSNDAEYEFIKQ